MYELSVKIIKTKQKPKVCKTLKKSVQILRGFPILML